MSIRNDWTDLSRGMAERAWTESEWNMKPGSDMTGPQIETARAGFSGRAMRICFVEGFVAGFLAAKKRDVVSTDPYHAEKP